MGAANHDAQMRGNARLAGLLENLPKKEWISKSIYAYEMTPFLRGALLENPPDKELLKNPRLRDSVDDPKVFHSPLEGRPSLLGKADSELRA